MKLVNFHRKDFELKFGYYANGRTAMTLNDPETGQTYAKATVNLINEPMDENEVAIKDYAENDGMYNALGMAGIISSPSRIVRVGYSSAPICTLLVEIPHDDT